MENIISFFLLLILTIQSSDDNKIVHSEPNCSECHSKVILGPVVHKAMNAGCDLCHVSTDEIHPKEGIKGFKLYEEIPELCYLCHDDYRDNKYLHDPAKNCLSCHSPHNGEKPKLLSTNFNENCKSCHEDVFNYAENSSFPHTPLGDKGECIECHSPHSSMEKRLLLQEDKKLCLSCHNKTFRGDEKTISNIDSLIQNSSMEHSAIEGGCSSCHLPHGSDFQMLLYDAYPEGNYASATYENFALCFLCHDSDLLEAEKTVYGTNFRNGEQNLHYLHMNGEKGRSCHLCHNIHASNQKFIIAERVPFGNWEMNMNFNISENGGSCLPGCHNKKDYSRIIAE